MRLRLLVAGGTLTAWCSLSALAAAPAVTPAPAPQAAAPAVSAEATEFFEKEIRPVLSTQCYACHGPKAKQSGLRVDSREFLLKGGNKRLYLRCYVSNSLLCAPALSGPRWKACRSAVYFRLWLLHLVLSWEVRD